MPARRPTTTKRLKSKDQVKAKTAKELDQTLLRELQVRYRSATGGSDWRNLSLNRFVNSIPHNAAGLRRLTSLLRQKGAFRLNATTITWRDTDGESRRFTLARAASTEMWPMGTHYWVRDNAIIGARLLKSEIAKERSLGKALLLSGLTFISSCAQLTRFRRIIHSTDQATISDPNNWPFIFAAIKDNLNTSHPEAWAHQQDAWQILAWHTLDALQNGAIKFSELTAKHRKFFGMIVPFLAKVSFWKRPNSGSWEEIAAVRTSVRAWEHRLIVRLSDLSKERNWSFLSSHYNTHRKSLGANLAKSTLTQGVRYLDNLATKAIARDLPYESPSYKRSDSRFREADSALLYLLEIDYVGFIAERLKRDTRWVRATESKILKQTLRLLDQRSGGIARYGNDSYQRSGFFRNQTVERLNKMYGAPSGDASAHFSGRDLLVPKGRRAAWTHFVWQIAAWSARKFLESGESPYRELHEAMFLKGLKLITGREVSLDISKDGRARVITIPPWRMPECYISERDLKGREMIIPSPHTPLNWSIAEMLSAFTYRQALIAR